MSVNASTTINAPMETVLRTFVDEAFVAHVCERAGTQLESFEVSGDIDTAFTVSSVLTVNADKLPDVVKKFVKGAVKLNQVDTYDAPSGDGSRHARTEIKAQGLPISATATQDFKPSEQETVIDVSGEVAANIPLVGKKIAGAAEPYIGKALTLQAREAETWISKH